MKTLLIAIVITPLLCGIGQAQTTGAGRPAPLERLNFLEGRWKVTGGVETEKGRQHVEAVALCEWVSRVLMCRDENLRLGEWGEVYLYSYNDRKGRYEAVFTDAIGQTVAHPVRWEGEQLISEYEYHVAGAYRRIRRTITPRGPGTLQSVTYDLGDDKVTAVIDLTGTRIDK